MHNLTARTEVISVRRQHQEVLIIFKRRESITTWTHNYFMR